MVQESCMVSVARSFLIFEESIAYLEKGRDLAKHAISNTILKLNDLRPDSLYDSISYNLKKIFGFIIVAKISSNKVTIKETLTKKLTRTAMSCKINKKCVC